VLTGIQYMPTFRCPACDAQVAVRLSVTAKGMELDPPTTGERAERPSARNARFLEAAKAAGLFDSFVHVVRTQKEADGCPRDLEEFFLDFWKSCQFTPVPRPILNLWGDEFHSRIEVLGYQGVLAVLAKGQLMKFFPSRLLVEARLDGGRFVPNTALFDEWTKHRYGYVPVSAHQFGEALRQHSLGAFAWPAQ
jgi:hypothetical protein